LLAARGGASTRLPYGVFGDAQWAAFVESWAVLGADPAGARAAWSAIPQAHALWAVRAGVLPGKSAADRVAPGKSAADRVAPGKSAADRVALSTLWERFPAEFRERVTALRSEAGLAGALPLLLGAPAAQTTAVVELLGPVDPLLELDEPELDDVRRWLVRRVHARVEGWRMAYALLAGLEQGVAAARCARSR